MNLNLVPLTASDPSAQGSGVMSIVSLIIPFALMFVLMYFMLIRPQNKKRKAEDKMRKSLMVGDEDYNHWRHDGTHCQYQGRFRFPCY